MATISHFSEEVSKEELKTHIQKAIPKKTKIARTCGLKDLS